MSFDAIPTLLADILSEQQRTNETLTRLVEAFAGIRSKIDSAKDATTKVIEKAAKVEQEVKENSKEKTETSFPAAPTFEQVRELIVGMERPKAVALLARFNAKRLGDVPAEKYADLVAAAKDA